MAKAIIWLRVSTTAQEIDSQKAALIKIATKKPYNFKKSDLITIGEVGASAIKMNALYQKEVDKLIDTINSTPSLTHIFVWEVSRLARNEKAFYEMKDIIIDKKIQLICCVPQIKLLDDDGKVNEGMEITLNLLVTLAKQEMQIKRERFSRGKSRKAEEGKYSGGNIPFGYKINKEKDNLIDTDDREAEIVHKIYDLYEEGYSQSKIAIELKERGYTNPRYKEPKIIQLGLITHILKNKCYIGKILDEKVITYFDKENNQNREYTRYQRKYPQIISTEQYNRCREIAKANRTTTGKGKNIYFATKLVKCLSCGCYWSASGSKVNYHCYNAIKQPKIWEVDGRKTLQCQNRTSMNINILDSLLWYFAKKSEAFFIMNASKRQIDEIKKKIDELKRNIETIPSQMEAIEESIDKAAERNVLRQMSDKKFNATFSDLQKEKNQLIDKKITLQKRIEEEENNIKQIKHILEKYGVKDKKNTIENAIKRGKEYIEQYNQIYDSLNSITDDRERYNIIHRQIGLVNVQNVNIKYKFKIGWRDTKGKKIILWYGNPEYDENGNAIYPMGEIFYYIPFNGKGNGVFLTSEYLEPEDNYITDDDGNILMENVEYIWEKDYRDISEAEFENDKEVHQVNIINIEYLNRYADIGKKKRREQEKEIAYNAVNGYLRIDEIMEKTNLHYNQIYNAIKRGKMKATIFKHKCYIPPTEAERFITMVNDKRG